MADRIKIIFGTDRIATWQADEKIEFFNILKKHNIKDLDTARLYQMSEEILGQLDAGRDFTIHSKIGFVPGTLSKKSVLSAGKESLRLLKIPQLETFFLHSPDAENPISETLEAVQELYKDGVFKNFGLSNFTPDQVQEVYDICKENSYILPTVYEGNYNAVARRQESTLFPLLRKLNIRFWAYSPIAGGFLTKDPSSFGPGNSGIGRFDPTLNRAAAMYHKLYNKPKLLEALKLWNEIASGEGIKPAVMAYRWIVYHSQLKPEYGDGLVLGATRPSQLDESLSAVEAGPLSDKAVNGIQEVWELAKDDAPLDNFNM